MSDLLKCTNPAPSGLEKHNQTTQKQTNTRKHPKIKETRSRNLPAGTGTDIDIKPNTRKIRAIGRLSLWLLPGHCLMLESVQRSMSDLRKRRPKARIQEGAPVGQHGSQTFCPILLGSIWLHLGLIWAIWSVIIFDVRSCIFNGRT